MGEQPFREKQILNRLNQAVAIRTVCLRNGHTIANG